MGDGGKKMERDQRSTSNVYSWRYTEMTRAAALKENDTSMQKYTASTGVSVVQVS